MAEKFNSFFARVSKALDIDRLSELAAIVNVNRSSITQARQIIEQWRDH